MNTELARENVIKRQLRPWGSLNEKANSALSSIPREYFVPQDYKSFAFADIEIPLNAQSKMLAPKIEGRILAALDIKKTDKVLEIGTGSGYLTAVIASLAKHIISIEINKVLADSAREKLNNLAIKNFEIQNKDINKDLKFNEKSFDVLVIETALPKISKIFLKLLKYGGRAFVVEGHGNCMAAKVIVRNGRNKWQTTTLFETHLETMQGLEKKIKFEF